jgi:hypothetical protein
MIRVEAIEVTLSSMAGSLRRPQVIAARRFGSPDACWDDADAFIAGALTALPPLAVGGRPQGRFLLTAEVIWSDGKSCEIEIPLAPAAAAQERLTWVEHSLARRVRGFLLQLRDQSYEEPGARCNPSPEAILSFVREREIGG